MEDSKRPKKLVMPKETAEAITFLQLASGIRSRAEIHDYLSYRNKGDFEADLKLWKKWFKHNQCKLTLQYVDSAFNKSDP